MYHTKTTVKLLAAVALTALTACGNSQKAMDNNSSNAVINNIMTRTSIRAFVPNKAVDSDQVETLLKAAMAAPTAVNKQPWAFVVVDEMQLLKTIGDSLPNTRVSSSNAPLAIVVCGDMQKTLEGENAAFWIQDTSAATENLLLAAHSMGLGALWTGIYPATERVNMLRNILHLPAHIIPLCVVPVGYPAEEPAIKDKWDVSKVHYNAQW